MTVPEVQSAEREVRQNDGGDTRAGVAAVQRPAQWDEWDRRMDAMQADLADSQRRYDWRVRMQQAATWKKRQALPPPFRYAETGDGPDQDARLLYQPDARSVADSNARLEFGKTQEPAYLAHCDNMSGVILDTETAEKMKARRAERLFLTMELARALEMMGVKCDYTNDPGRPKAFIVDPILEIAVPLPDLRRVNFFPEWAAARRSPLLKEVETWLLAHPLDRMATFTRGKRVPLRHAKRFRQAFVRRLSKLNARPWFKRYGCSLVFRGVEYGEPKCEPLFGPEWTVHIHAHVIFHMAGYLQPEDWNEMLRRVRAYMGAHWEPGRRVENVRELVKYCVKPADLLKMVKEGGAELVKEFYDQTFKARHVELLGGLRKQRGTLRRVCHKRLYEQGADGRFLTTRPDWNSRKRPGGKTAEEKKRVRLREERKAHAAVIAARLARLPEQETGDDEDETPTNTPFRTGDRKTPPMLNRIVARIAPAPLGGRVYSPSALVWNFDGNFAAIRGHSCMRDVCARVSGRVLAAREGAVNPSPHQSPICPPGAPPGAGLLAFGPPEMVLAGVN